MSTRGFYVFRSGNEAFNVYKHSDNYPEGEHGGFAAIGKAGALAWPLPRFEPDEFAAAFVAANKRHLDPKYPAELRGGGVRLAASGEWRDVCPADVEYLYIVEPAPDLVSTCKTAVRCFAVSCEWGKSEWILRPVHLQNLARVIGGWYPKRSKAA